MSSVAELNLLNLPADIARMVIPGCLEDFNTVKLISPRWYALAIQYLEHRSRLPSVHSCRWSVVAGRSTLSIAVQTRFRTYFGLQNWKCPDDIEDSAQPVEFISGDPTKLVQLAKIANRCSRIDTIEVDVKNLNDVSGTAFLKTLMSKSYMRYAIGSLTISGNQPNFTKNGLTIIKLVEAAEVKRLVFVSNVPGAIDFNVIFPYLGYFFKRVSTVELTLKQCWSTTNALMQQETNADRKAGCLELVEELNNTSTHTAVNNGVGSMEKLMECITKINNRCSRIDTLCLGRGILGKYSLEFAYDSLKSNALFKPVFMYGNSDTAKISVVDMIGFPQIGCLQLVVSEVKLIDFTVLDKLLPALLGRASTIELILIQPEYVNDIFLPQLNNRRRTCCEDLSAMLNNSESLRLHLLKSQKVLVEESLLL